MSILTLDMSSYEARLNDSTAKEYDDEILYSGWVPTLALQQSQAQGFENQASIEESLANVDISAFLRKMYAYQR
ncbi:MAG: hypothetical protein HY016_12280 [Nitrosomonadales bacterium]|nr:hypothetical protein [Nitrosomonadales bacterium]